MFPWGVAPESSVRPDEGGRGPTGRRNIVLGGMISSSHYRDIESISTIASRHVLPLSAVSSKGARGLGQMMFATARAVAPAVVRRVENLYAYLKTRRAYQHLIAMPAIETGTTRN